MEEFAKRLGKTLKEEKQTRDIVDIVLKNERISPVSPISDEKPKERVLKVAKSAQEIQNKIIEKQEEKVVKPDFLASINLTFKKPLTQREQLVLEYFVKNSNQIVYAKDLAKVLELPTDYVYKYIKNLRTKVNEDVLQNATKGGYKLTI